MKTFLKQFSVAVIAFGLTSSLHALTSVTITAPSSANVSSTYYVSVSGYDDMDAITDLTVTRNGVYWKSASYDPWDSPRTDISVSGNNTAPSTPGSVSFYATMDTDYTSVTDSDSVSIVDTIAPSVPTGLSASNNTTGNSFTLSWSASTDNVGVTAYEVKRSGTSLGTVTGTSKSVTGLNDATTYGMQVRAKDAANNWSAWSSTLNVTTPDKTAPSVPTGLSSSSVTETSFTLSWSASSDNVGVTSYEVQKDGAYYGSTSGTSLSITGLSAWTTYSMKVKARDAAGNWSVLSAAKSVKTDDTTVPSTPTGLSESNVAENSFTLSWTASTDNVGVTAYEVKRGTTSLGTVSGTSKSVTGLAPGTAYSMTVEARDEKGNGSGWSAAKSVTTDDSTAPSTPTGLYASNITTNSFVLNWTASTDNVGVTGYQVQKDDSDYGSVVTGTSLTIDTGVDLTGSNSYAMKVKAKDAEGNWSGFSVVLNVAADSDSDGINDWFEQLIIDDNPSDGFVDFTDVTPTSNYDGDAITDLDEFLLGTDPTATASSGGTTVDLQPHPLLR